MSARTYQTAEAFKQALALIATAGPLDARRLRDALEKTFAFRQTHGLPGSLPLPPDSWTAPYATIALGDRLPWATLQEVHEAARKLLEPVLAGRMEAKWDPAAWAWETSSPGHEGA